MDPAIELVGIDKKFGAVHANKNINLTVAKGSIHGIIGENGAGKSTLMSILYGFYKPDSGEILIKGKPIQITDSMTAIRAGIGMVFQHFKLVRNFTVLENIILGAEDGPMLNTSLTRARAELKRLASEYELQVDPLIGLNRPERFGNPPQFDCGGCVFCAGACRHYCTGQVLSVM